MKLADIINCIEIYAPLQLQESYDNSGLLLGNQDAEVNKCLVCLDVTEDIIEEALKLNCDLIISHHPVVFGKGLKKLTGDTMSERIILSAVRNNISIYSVHTNLDSVYNGLNKLLCDKLSIKNTTALFPREDVLRKLVTFCPTDRAADVRYAIFKAGAGHIGNYDCCSFNTEGKGSFRANDDANPYIGEKGHLHYEDEIRIETIYPLFLEKNIISAMLEAHPYEEVAYDIYPLSNKFNKAGSGLIGDLSEAIPANDFLLRLKNRLNLTIIKHTKLTDNSVKRVAICSGSGSFLINDAIRCKADLFITSDLKYHDYFIAEDKLIIADIGHYESEQCVKELINIIIVKKFPTFAVEISKVNTNPIKIYI